MKKFAVVFVLAFGIIFAQASAAQEQDYYVGNSSTTGMDCYLMTHTITELRHYSDGGLFSARLKMVGRTVQYLDYEFDIGLETIKFRNSAGYSGEVTPHGTPIEWHICQYIVRNYL